MNKEDFIKYINQAVEALDDHDINALFPENNQPDLNTVVQELIGLRGEVRKLAQSSLRMNNDVQTVSKKTFCARQKSICLWFNSPLFKRQATKIRTNIGNF
jgi:hypothetical protein